MSNPNLKPMHSTGNDNWGTDLEGFKALDEIFGFELDVCASAENAKCDVYIDEQADTLKQKWGDKVCWMNPPFSQPEGVCRMNCAKKICGKRGYHNEIYRPGQIDFVRKASREAMNGSWVVCLVPSRTDTVQWHTYLLRAGAMMFDQGRRTFEGAENGAPFPCTVFVFEPGIQYRTPEVMLSLGDLKDKYYERVKQWKRERTRNKRKKESKYEF